MRTPILAALLLVTIFAGCNSPGTWNYYYQHVNCEALPWDGNSIADHYGIDVFVEWEEDDGIAYTEQCGGKNSTWTHIRSESDRTDAMLDDGWRVSMAELPVRDAYLNQLQCEDPFFSETRIANYYMIDVLSEETVDDGRVYATECGAPSSTHIHIVMLGELTSQMVHDGWVETIAMA